MFTPVVTIDQAMQAMGVRDRTKAEAGRVKAEAALTKLRTPACTAAMQECLRHLTAGQRIAIRNDLITKMKDVSTGVAGASGRGTCGYGTVHDTVQKIQGHLAKIQELLSPLYDPALSPAALAAKIEASVTTEQLQEAEAQARLGLVRRVLAPDPMTPAEAFGWLLFGTCLPVSLVDRAGPVTRAIPNTSSELVCTNAIRSRRRGSMHRSPLRGRICSRSRSPPLRKPEFYV